jgi:hypothetical protein
MRHLKTGLIGLLLSLSSFAHAQTPPQITEGWTLVVDGESPTYIHQGTLIKCPSQLTDGYVITRALANNAVNEVACFYKRGEDGTVSFHWAQGIGTIQQEIADERKFWSAVFPGARPEARELDWNIGDEAAKIAISEATTIVPATQKKVGISFSIGTVLDRRIKANELWVGSGEASNRATANFFALQTAAVNNRKTCLAYGLWPTQTRARLSPDPSESATTAAIILLAKTVVETEQKTEQAAGHQICHSIFAGIDGEGASLLSQRTGVQEMRVVLSGQDEGDIVAALGTRPKDLKAQVDRDSPYFLYGKQGKLLAIFRSYRSLPNYQQLVGDIAAIASGELKPIAVISSDLDDGKIELNTDPEEVEAEKAKRRPGSG